MTTKVTPELVKEWSDVYVEDADKRCPLPDCRSKDLQICAFDDPALSSGAVFREVLCQACESYWYEEHSIKLTGIKHLRIYSDGYSSPDLISPAKGKGT